MLREACADHLSDIARKLRAKLTKHHTVASHALVLHLIYKGESVSAGKYNSARGRLKRSGHIDSKDGEWRGTNGKLLKDYFLTKLGEDVHDEIQEVYTPIVNRINQQQKQAV